MATSDTATLLVRRNPDVGPNGNFYQIVSPPSITWSNAQSLAEQRGGHLATITSAEEDVFIDSMRECFLDDELWVGGFQNPGEPSPGSGWMWVNAEGSFAGANGGPGYANWRPGEPNDAGGPGSENYLTIGWGGQFGWNDTANVSTLIKGYVVEYENRPPVLSNPLRLPNGDFQFTAQGTPNRPQTVQTTTNLSPADWLSLLTTNTVTGAFSFTDPSATTLPQRFYRVLQQ
jgi:hypothetical protein